MTLARRFAGSLRSPQDRAGAAGWSALLGLPAAQSCADDEADAWVERICDLISPALAEELLAAAGPCSPKIEPERARKAQLYNRFLLKRQVEAVRILRRAGLGFVCLKGFALAHQVYRRPEARILGDVDLMFRPEDLPKAASVLAAAGYAAMPIPSRFGFIAQSSFLPIVSADGQVALDLHLAPDAWPASRALDADALIRRARCFRVEEMELLGPAPEDSFFLVVTNIAKDRFGPEGLRKVLDAALLLRAEAGFDWDLLQRYADAGGYRRALAALLHLMEGLGARVGAPDRLRRPLRGLAALELGRVTVQYRRAQVARLGFAGKLRRELLLGPKTFSVLRINAIRLRGLVRPGSGLPPGIVERRARTGP